MPISLPPFCCTARWAGLVGLLALLGGCASRPAPPVTPPAAPVAAEPAALIVAIRPIPGTTPASGTVLRSVAPNQSPGGDASALYEFVVTLDDGRAVSVVQPNDADLAVGERVMLAPGPQTRLHRS